MVECTGLENQQGGNILQGSNPCPSATTLNAKHGCYSLNARLKSPPEKTFKPFGPKSFFFWMNGILNPIARSAGSIIKPMNHERSE